jgi:hypothetical protein
MSKPRPDEPLPPTVRPPPPMATTDSTRRIPNAEAQARAIDASHNLTVKQSEPPHDRRSSVRRMLAVSAPKRER